jgi:hypothetical protein
MRDPGCPGSSEADGQWGTNTISLSAPAFTSQVAEEGVLVEDPGTGSNRLGRRVRTAERFL